VLLLLLLLLLVAALPLPLLAQHDWHCWAVPWHHVSQRAVHLALALPTTAQAAVADAADVVSTAPSTLRRQLAAQGLDLEADWCAGGGVCARACRGRVLRGRGHRVARGCADDDACAVMPSWCVAQCRPCSLLCAHPLRACTHTRTRAHRAEAEGMLSSPAARTTTGRAKSLAAMAAAGGAPSQELLSRPARPTVRLV
jgi:hypothetical protein